VGKERERKQKCRDKQSKMKFAAQKKKNLSRVFEGKHPSTNQLVAAACGLWNGKGRKIKACPC